MALIIDVVLIVIIALMVVLGIKRGLVKTIVGLVSTLIVIAVAIAAVTPLTNLVMAFEVDEKVQSALEAPLAGQLPNAYAKVYYYDIDEDASTKELIYEIDNVQAPIDNILKDKPLINALFAKTIVKNAEKMLATQVEGTETDVQDITNTIDYIDAVTIPVTTLIFTAICFVALLIVARFGIWLLLKIAKKLISRLYVVHFVDKMLGGVFGLAAGVIFILILLTIVQVLSVLDFMAPVNEYLNNTFVTKFIMDNNFIYTFLMQSVNLGELMGNIGG
ncbi:MAG: CvpA family protein [Clostridia bacterium]|nr:CvpA family protein [Clostridia bacterium]